MVGDHLFILNDKKTLPNGRLLNIPLKENWVDGTLWKKGGCVPAMGMGNFFLKVCKQVNELIRRNYII